VVVEAVSMMAFWLGRRSEPLGKALHTVFVTNTIRYVHCTCGTALGSTVSTALLRRTWRSTAHEDIGPPPLDS
jgi:hypothetical protein